MAPSSELHFTGASRRALLAWLLATFVEVKNQRQPRLVLLEAESGWGKSRLVQEFYKAIAADQSSPRYWPPSILEAVAEAERPSLETPAGRRKRIYPETFEVPKKAVPEWLWWGISATSRQGGTIRSLDHDLVQLRRHAPHLERRWRELASFRKKTSEVLSKKRLREAVQAGTVDLIGNAVLPVPFVGSLLTTAGKALLKGLVERREDGPELIGDLREEGQGLVDQVATELGRFAEVGIPVVIAVEDVHDANESLIDFLVGVVEKARGPIMVLATAWPRGTGPTARLRAETSVSRRDVRALDHEDPHLSEAERMTLIASRLPKASERQCRDLARHYENVYAIEIACGLNIVQQLLDDGGLSAEEIQRLPVDLDGLWSTDWDSLEPTTQFAIALSVLASPASVSDLFRGEPLWDSALVLLAAEPLGWAQQYMTGLDGEDSDEAIRRAWIRRIDDWLRTCHEPAKFRLIRHFADSNLTERRLQEYWRSLAECVDMNEEVAVTRREVRAMLLVSMASRSLAVWDERTISAADLIIERAYDFADDSNFQVVVNVGRAVEDPDLGRRLGRLLLVVSALTGLGRFSEALDTARHVLSLLVEREDESSANALMVRSVVASCLGMAEQWKAAVDAHERLVADWTMKEGRLNEGTLEARERLIDCLGHAGFPKEAIEQASMLVDDWSALRDRGSEEVRRARRLRARWRGAAGFHREAEAELRALLAERASDEGASEASLRDRLWLLEQLFQIAPTSVVLAEAKMLLDECAALADVDDSLAVEARWTFAAALGEDGRVAECIDMLEQLLRDLEEEGDELSARRIRATLIAWRSKSDISQAIADLRTVVRECVASFGEEHPMTLDAERYLAALLRTAGAYQESEDLLAHVVGIRLRLFGDSHRKTFVDRVELALTLAARGASDRAEAELRAVARAATDASGDATLFVLNVWHNLAAVLQDLGQTHDALRLWEEVIVKREAISGPGHAEVLNAKINRAWSLGAVGEIAAAVDEHKRLLEVALARFASPHEIIGRLLCNYGYWLGESGDLRTALDTYDEGIGMKMNLHGPASYSTLRSRISRAVLLGRDGQDDAAVAELVEVVSLCESHFGRLAPISLIGNRALLTLQVSSMGVGAAVGLEQLLERFGEVLPSDHPEIVSTQSAIEDAWRRLGRV